jgi:methylated-DNA-[protein]-cysteine S-methyltransferase
MIHRSCIESPLGPLLIEVSDAGVHRIGFDAVVVDEPPSTKPGHPLLEAVRRQLDDYFAGRRRRFELPLATAGTAFQRQVWQALQQIPYGETRSYAGIAQAIGSPRAVRAVGAANGRNPVAIVVPCHRVIGSSGGLTGYAGGLHRKLALLRVEGVPLLVPRESPATDAAAGLFR